MEEIVELNLNIDRPIKEGFPRLGALPPAIQRMRELKSILADPFLYDRLGASELIESLEKTDNGYIIHTQNYSVSVEVVYLHEGRKIGPAEFRLEFSEPVPRTALGDHRLRALPPAIQRMHEIQALLADPFLYDSLGAAELIERIEKTEKGYAVYTHNYSVSVAVVYLHEGRKIGPAEFRLEFSEPVPRN